MAKQVEPYMANVAFLAKRTGLARKTVLDLLSSGWTYAENINEPSRWISPLAQLKEAGK